MPSNASDGMKRIYVIYGGTTFSVSGREPEDLRAEIAAAFISGEPRWLRVNYGEGTPAATDLLLAPGISVALSIPGGGPDGEFNEEDEKVPSSGSAGPLRGSAMGDGMPSVGELAGDA